MAELTRVRLGTDITMRRTATDGGVLIDFNTCENIKCFIANNSRSSVVSIDHIIDASDPTVIQCEFPASMQKMAGVYSLAISLEYRGSTVTFDCEAFEIVMRTADIAQGRGDVDIITINLNGDLYNASTSVLEDLLRKLEIAAAAVSYPPIIGEDNYWYLWNMEANEYQSSGVKAEGTDGHSPTLSIDEDGNLLIDGVVASTALADEINIIKTDEATRVANEIERQENEATRITNESNRMLGESTRITAENERASAEKTRVRNENSRISAERQRTQKEGDRQGAENQREYNEGIRKQNETLRVGNETDRINAERNRETTFASYNARIAELEALNAHAVKYTEQELTPEEQENARKNIDAIGVMDDTDWEDITGSTLANKLDKDMAIGRRCYVDGDLRGEIFNQIYENSATGQNSHAEGWCTSAIGWASHAEGCMTYAAGDYGHAEGNSNVYDEDAIHQVGIGWDGDGKDAHNIKQDGRHYILGVGGFDGTNSNDEGVKHLATVISELESGSSAIFRPLPSDFGADFNQDYNN